jgi:hypothetical protein
MNGCVVLKRLPDYREKQRLLYIDRRSNQDLTAYGDKYLESGRISDATDFYQKANHLQGLETIKKIAEEAGDVMAFQSALKALKQNATDDDWNRIGQKALEQKKYAFAIFAFQKTGNTLKMEEIKNMIISEDRINAS